MTYAQAVRRHRERRERWRCANYLNYAMKTGDFVPYFMREWFKKGHAKILPKTQRIVGKTCEHVVLDEVPLMSNEDFDELLKSLKT